MPIRNYTKLKINQSTDNDRNSNKNFENNTAGNNTPGNMNRGTDTQNDTMMNGYISGDRTGSSSAHQFHRSDPDGKIR